MLQNNRKGISLLEITIAIIIFSLIINIMLNVIGYVTDNVSRIVENNEVFSNGKLSIEFIQSEIERATYIDFYVYEDNSLEKIIIFKDEYKIYKEANIIYFYKEGNGTRSNTIQFGGVSSSNVTYTNKFSEYIKNIEINLKENMICIEIITLDNLSGNEVKQRIFNSKINIKNKNTNFYKKSIDTNLM